MTAQQLKASILQLAIQGKLVPQNPEDEPASVLLKKIKAEKDALVKAGKIKKDKHESVIVRAEDGRYLEKKDGKTTDITDEIPFDIPDSWEWTRLGTMVDKFQYGTAEKSSLSGKVPVLRMGNLQNGEIDYTKLVFSSNENDIQQYKLHFGDLLFNRTNSAELVGKTSVFRSDTDAIFAGYLIRFRPILANSFYVNFVMNSSYQRGYCQSVRSDAINQSNINAQKLSLFLVPLPPLEEQARIVAKIEELLPHVEEYGKAETELSKLNAELPEQLKKSILQWAIQGRLVPQDPTDEPASELLKRIKAEKAALIKSGKLKKEKPLPPITEDEIPFDIPDNWAVSRIGDCLNLVNGRAYKQTELLNSGKYRVLRVGNFFTNSSWYYSDLELPDEKYCYRGDLLYAWSASFGPRIWDGDKTIFHYHIWNVKFDERLFEKKYLYYFLLWDKERLEESKTGSTMVHVSMEHMKPRLIFIPPLAEQKRIVETLETLMSICNSTIRIHKEV